MKHSAQILLAVILLSGCETVQSIRNDIRDRQRPQEGAEDLQYKQLFEAGRRSETKGDFRIAGDTYGWLIGRGNRYGEYGLAMLLLRRQPESRDAVKNLISCAKRSSHTSDMFPDSAMDSAFSAAAMVKLADIAASEHDRHDVAASLRGMANDIVTPQVRAWAAEKKAEVGAAAIYKDIISAVESSRQSSEYVKALKWPEIGDVLMNGSAFHTSRNEAKELQSESGYSVVSFVKASDAACRYDFEVMLSGDHTFEAAEKVRSAIRRQLTKEFLALNPHDSADDIRISFLFWNQQESTIKGSVSVMKVSAVRMKYDAVTRRGMIAVRLDGRDMAAARKWAIENIAELATGKNVVLVVGKPPPPGAAYNVGSERMTEDGLLEIEFKTE